MRTPNTPPSAMRKWGGEWERRGEHIGSVFFHARRIVAYQGPGAPPKHLHTARCSPASGRSRRTLTWPPIASTPSRHTWPHTIDTHPDVSPKRRTRHHGVENGTNRRRILLCAEEAKEKKYSSSTHPPGTMSTVFADPWETPPTAGMRIASLKVMYPRSDATPAFKSSTSS